MLFINNYFWHLPQNVVIYSQNVCKVAHLATLLRSNAQLYPPTHPPTHPAAQFPCAVPLLLPHSDAV